LILAAISAVILAVILAVAAPSFATVI